MEKHLPVLKRSKLFCELTDKEISLALACLNGTVKQYEKATVIFSEGETANRIGIVLSGEIEIQKTDLHGNVNFISRSFPTEIIGAAVSYSNGKKLPFDVVCACESELLWIDSRKLISQCSQACAFHTKLIGNMLGLIADKNIQLTDKIDVLTKRSIREKLLTYLHTKSKRTTNKRFSINLSRRQLSDFLSVDRSAMIRELGKMKSEGIINFENNVFWLE